MHILFTTSKYPTSWLIRKITGEPVSHCAIVIGNIVIHSNFKGVIVETVEDFKKHSKVLYYSKVHATTYKLYAILSEHLGKRYDFKALLYLFFRVVFKRWTKKQNLWQTTGMFLCTELVTKVLNGQEDSLITPYQLYLKLKEKENGERIFPTRQS